MEDITFKTIKGVSFGTYSTDEIRKLSALEITQTEILDCLGHPTPYGLYDLRLGPNEKDDSCGTCGLNFWKCPGHTGHISLPVSVFNPVFFPHLYKLLRGTCFHCHRLLAPPIALHLALYQLQALDHGLISTVQDLAEIVTDSNGLTQDDQLANIQQKLKRMFEDASLGINLSDSKGQVKSVVECRQNIIKQFVKHHMMGVTGHCPHCRMPRKVITRFNMRIVYTDGRKTAATAALSSGDSNVPTELSNKELTPEEAKKHLHLVWEKDKVFLQHLYKALYQVENVQTFPIDMFFMNVIIVIPSKFRRLNVMKGRKYADAQTLTYNEILKDCTTINKLIKKVKNLPVSEIEKDEINKLTGKTDGEKFNHMYFQLQKHVNELFDSDTNKDKTSTSKGIKQILEKKQGLFRMNMMGKRVNYAARSVISPDPYIMVNEIGIPLVFAKKLTFPEPVSHWNFENLRKAVMNGPNVHPGASLVVLEDGKVQKLMADDPVKRQAIANTLLTPPASGNKRIGGVKIVHRHLKNGDMLLLNRQPTLHKPSIMAHKARVLPGEKTLRLHYANCKSYNADFDGDEMNAHLPQCLLGQSEARHVVGVNHQYLVPKDGTPLSGLIQDHIIAGVLLTMRGRFFSREDYQQLIYSAMSFFQKRLKLLPPAIIKPQKLWSGKQIVSTIVINLIPEGKDPPSVEGRAKLASKNWKTCPSREWKFGGTPLQGDNMTESEVIIQKGELLCGVIDKAQVGPTPYSLIHLCYELYGGETSSILLTALARLFTHFLQYHSGFSLGIEDIVVNPKANRQRRKILKKAARMGLEATAKSLDMNLQNLDVDDLHFKYKEVHFNRDDFGMKMLDMGMKNVTHTLNNEINEVCIPSGLRKKFPRNNLQLMVESGAKGSTVNAMQISCLLGQIELEGRRMPLMLNGSTLPSFKPYETSPQAGGFVGGRFLSGINPQEYFFHCMAGREGLIDTAVKTSRSGYLQRCLIKHLEGITVNYDLTVRDSDGTVIQFLYGEDGMDPLKNQLLKDNRLHLLAKNYKSAVSKSDIKRLKSRLEVDHDPEKKKVKKWRKKHPVADKTRISRIGSLQDDPDTDIKLRLSQVIQAKKELNESATHEYELKIQKCPNPVNSKHRPDINFGSVSENMDALISEYMSKNPHRLIGDKSQNGDKGLLSREKFKDLCFYRSMRALAAPGEAVGLLAAQSIGEPSTQMTLNTFHFAGKGEMNVTLGIPRIREILMTASANIATPTMDLPLLDRPDIEMEADWLKLMLSPAPLKDVLKDIKVKEFLSVSKPRMYNRIYDIRLNFLKHSEYKGYLNTSPSKILYYIENVFIKKLIEAIKRKIKKSSSAKFVSIMRDVQSNASKQESMDSEEVDQPAEAKGDEGESSAESEGEGDTSSSRSKMRHDQDQEYEDPEDVEMIPESDEENSDKEVDVKKEIPSDEENTPCEIVTPAKKSKTHDVTEEEKAIRVNRVKCLNSWIGNYDFDPVSERWCDVRLQLELSANKVDMKSLLEEEVAKTNVYSVPQIKEAILIKDPSDKEGNKMMLKTNGVNFLEIFRHVDILDINKAYSNNIHVISKIYGIEAAARAIRKEIVNVFAAYGIEVDQRHLSLISDYMTSSGEYRPCNRLGMEGNASPLQQMTFETTNNFMVDAMLMGVEDRIKSPSANIIVGKLYHAGTGAFDLFCRTGRTIIDLC